MSKNNSPHAARRGGGNRSHVPLKPLRLRTLVAIGIVLAAGQASAAKPALSSSLSIERPVITRGWTKPVYVLVHFTAPELEVKPSERPPY